MEDKTKIPYGPYCYNEKGRCPYWSYRDKIKNKTLDEMESGYCSFLGKGDYELNREIKYVLMYPKNHPDHGKPMTSEEIGMYMSLLWDQCKMCGENDE